MSSGTGFEMGINVVDVVVGTGACCACACACAARSFMIEQLSFGLAWLLAWLLGYSLSARRGDCRPLLPTHSKLQVLTVSSKADAPAWTTGVRFVWPKKEVCVVSPCLELELHCRSSKTVHLCIRRRNACTSHVAC